MEVSRRGFVAGIGAAAAAGRIPIDPADQSDDPLGVRADFPVTVRATYFNSAYITPSPTPVLDAGQRFVEAKARAPIAVPPMQATAERVRASYADLIGASPAEIGLLYSTSDGENIFVNSLGLQRGDNVVVDELHYDTSFVLYAQMRDTRGVELRIVRPRDGAADPADFAPLIDARTKVVSVSWISHQNGFRHDLRGLAELAHARGALLYVDGIQGVGALRIDVRAEGVDMMTVGTYKWLLGGFGVAPTYIRHELLDRIQPDRLGWAHVARRHDGYRFDLHPGAKRLEYATLPFAEVYMLEAGLQYVKRVGVDRIEAHGTALANSVRSGLVEQGFRVLTPAGNRSHIVSFIHGIDPQRVDAAMKSANVLATLRENNTQVRVACAMFNTADDVAQLLAMTRQWR
jgi:selenocysteine lyase/cysteine desulfurase